MPDKFLNRYRIPPARLFNWDYSSNAAYFLTICTASRQHYFGEIIDSEMQLSKIGEYATECWMKIPDHFPHFYLDASVVMPNHIHGIVLIEKPFVDNCRGSDIVETRHALSLRQPNFDQSPQSESESNRRISVSTTRERTRFQQWLDHSNPRFQNFVMKIICRLAGNRDFMIISFAIRMNFIESEIISLIIRKIGKKIGFIHNACRDEACLISTITNIYQGFGA